MAVRVEPEWIGMVPAQVRRGERSVYRSHPTTAGSSTRAPVHPGWTWRTHRGSRCAIVGMGCWWRKGGDFGGRRIGREARLRTEDPASSSAPGSCWSETKASCRWSFVRRHWMVKHSGVLFARDPRDEPQRKFHEGKVNPKRLTLLHRALDRVAIRLAVTPSAVLGYGGAVADL